MINNKKSNLAYLLTKDFKEFLKELVFNSVKLNDFSENIDSLDFDYKEFFIIVDCSVSNEYIEDEGDGYFEPRHGGYDVKCVEFSNLRIYDNEIEISEKETNIIINFLNK